MPLFDQQHTAHGFVPEWCGVFMEICCILLIIDLPTRGVVTTNVVLIGMGKGRIGVFIVKDVFGVQAICIPRFCGVVGLLCAFDVYIAIGNILFLLRRRFC